MINIGIFVTSIGDILGFEISGHSGYSDSGSDIVCASVSSVVYLIINTLMDILKISLVVNVSKKKSYLRFVLDNERDCGVCKNFLLGLKNHLISLKDSYPKYIKINYSEV
ncbi:MAG: ribosomal-processing cysteine protease Prp [Candidatus Paraimprobicoccus trichonymphae]|uniref:Ribosomal processing cysteine protease Prp n=1 Tax=Candidatus Paraimprobicoccus trichonymphae TaxID=3033793 RepID=A0AA48HZ76_9FIRM|nr:MAG: ribosomal-processing cysteine protease Prp [Candidatus Paraimprobicoccus trichonymphae]